jgi:hypothetical protein
LTEAEDPMTENEISELLARLREAKMLILNTAIADIESLRPGAARLLASEVEDLRAALEGLGSRAAAAAGSTLTPASAAPQPISDDVRITLGPGDAAAIDLTTALRLARDRIDDRGRPVLAIHLTTQDGRTAWIEVPGPDAGSRDPHIHYSSYGAQSPREAARDARLIQLAAAIADSVLAPASLRYAGERFSLHEEKAAELVDRAIANPQDPGLPDIDPSWDPTQDDGTVQALITAAQDAEALTGPGAVDFYRTPDDGEGPGYEWQVRAAAADGSEIRLTHNGSDLLYLAAGCRGADAAMAVLREAAEEADSIYSTARLITTNNPMLAGPGRGACTAPQAAHENPGAYLEP